MSKNENGFCFGNMAISAHDSFSNCLTVGSTGSGKSSTILVNSIINAENSSIIIHDPSGNFTR
ncbi:MAG: type IV secretory system conjugative DNA transfer family protein [Bacteroidetes bacterium]|nr:type IV secretory system conjugative DNA transfer family protein [Bacteroidota bacterium]